MSTDTNRLPALPQDTANKLTALKGTCPEEFYALVSALRTEGWPLRAIADPLGVSRTAVANWGHNPAQPGPPPDVPKMPAPPAKEPKKSKKPQSLPDEEAQELRELAAAATSVRRYTDQNAASRRAATELERRLIGYRKEGYSFRKLASYAEVSDSSLKQRLRKY